MHIASDNLSEHASRKTAPPLTPPHPSQISSENVALPLGPISFRLAFSRMWKCVVHAVYVLLAAENVRLYQQDNPHCSVAEHSLRRTCSLAQVQCLTTKQRVPNNHIPDPNRRNPIVWLNENIHPPNPTSRVRQHQQRTAPHTNHPNKSSLSINQLAEKEPKQRKDSSLANKQQQQTRTSR